MVHGEGLPGDPVPEDCFVDTLTQEQQNAIWMGVLFVDPAAVIKNAPRDADYALLNRVAVERVFQCWPDGPFAQWCDGDFSVFNQPVQSSQGTPS